VRVLAAIALLALLTPPARVDHACSDGMLVGHEIKRDRPFPREWFGLGRESILDPGLHAALKKKYPHQYVSGYEEGSFGDFCVKDAGGYLTLSTSDFGPSAWFSRAKPKCGKCTALPGFRRQHASGTGLRVGLTKAQVAAIIGAPVDSDALSVTYEEKVTEQGARVLHTEVLGLEFRNGRLDQFMVADYR